MVLYPLTFISMLSLRIALAGLLVAAPRLAAATYSLDWNDPGITWTANVTVTGTMGDTGNYTYSQSFDVDPLNPGNDITVTITEVFSADPNNPSRDTPTSLEFNYDHIGDTQNLDANGNIVFGPYEIANHTFGNPSNTGEKLKIVARDYSMNRTLDANYNGYVEVKFSFSSYGAGVTNIAIPIYDVDWRGGEGGTNNEQDRIWNVVAYDINGNPVGVTATSIPWASGTEAPTNSYIIINGTNGYVDQIIAGNPADYALDPNYVLNPDGTSYPPSGNTPGFNSADNQGWGNLILSATGNVGIAEISYRWGANPNNTSGGNTRRGWGHEVGVITYSSLVPEPSTALAAALLAATAAFAGARRRRSKPA